MESTLTMCTQDEISTKLTQTSYISIIRTGSKLSDSDTNVKSATFGLQKKNGVHLIKMQYSFICKIHRASMYFLNASGILNGPVFYFFFFPLQIRGISNKRKRRLNYIL